MKKIILTLTGFCFLFASATGQETEWENTIGGDSADNICSVQQTADGGYIVAGSSRSDITGDKTENCMGGWDYWIIKTDASGNIQWQNTIGGSGWDVLAFSQQTPDGGYILGGSSSSDTSGDKTEKSLMDDYWIVKTDASGNIQWQNTITGNSTDKLTAIHQTADGGYILGGYSASDSSGDKTENNIGLYDYWIVKTDASGNIQWQNTIGGTGGDNLYSLQQTNDGGYILGGSSSSDSSGDKTENSIGPSGYLDYWIVKTDSLGTIQWENTIGGNSTDNLASIVQTTDGGYIMGGFSQSAISGDKTDYCYGGGDMWIVKTDASGNIEWQKTLKAFNNDGLYSLQQTIDGGYIVSGYSLSDFSRDKTEGTMGPGGDCWIIKTDSLGNIQWQNTLGGSDSDWGVFIQQTADGDYILACSSKSFSSGDKTEDNWDANCSANCTYDYWLVKLTGDYNLIKGKLFYDVNSNNVQDTGEPVIQNKKVSEINTGRFGFSDRYGNYSTSVLDSGNFTVYPSSQVNYYSAVPATHSAHFTGMHQTDSINDFAFQPAGIFNDLCVTISPPIRFRAGFNAYYKIIYENIGTTTLNPTVIFFPDNDLSFVSATPSASSVTTDSAVWNLGPLTPFQTGSIFVTVNVNVGVPIGTLIHSVARIEPIAGDANPACNISYQDIHTVGSYDPNEIIVDEDTLLTTQFPNPPYLDYIIFFQNTGNDTAINIKILNPMDTFHLELNTLEFVASSHPVNIKWIPWERSMEFKFDSILLPHTFINEPASHGFVRYRIKPKSTLVAGDRIVNYAAIYFDFNSPVITDTAVTEIVLPTGVSSQWSVASGQLAVYPNPARDELIVSSKQLKEKGIIRIFDLFGREVFQLQTSNFKLQTKINVSGFSQGIYFVEMQSGEQVLRGKFLKQ